MGALTGRRVLILNLIRRILIQYFPVSVVLYRLCKSRSFSGW
jgi:hypothetical protein